MIYAWICCLHTPQFQRFNWYHMVQMWPILIPLEDVGSRPMVPSCMVSARCSALVADPWRRGPRGPMFKKSAVKIFAALKKHPQN
jgi:hypothetical protein